MFCAHCLTMNADDAQAAPSVAETYVRLARPVLRVESNRDIKRELRFQITWCSPF